jgi:hypothetical protein
MTTLFLNYNKHTGSLTVNTYRNNGVACDSVAELIDECMFENAETANFSVGSESDISELLGRIKFDYPVKEHSDAARVVLSLENYDDEIPW